MTRAFTLTLILMFVVMGCASTQGPGAPSTATVVLADITCVAALAGAGVAVAGNPLVGGAVTAAGVLTAIAAVGTSNVPGAVISACADSLKYAGQDLSGLLALVKGSTPKPGPAPAPVPAARINAMQPPTPTPVTVLIK